MRKAHPSPIFSPDLDRSLTCSLSLIFILEEMLLSFALIERLQKSADFPMVFQEIQKLHTLGLEEAPLAQKRGSFSRLCFYSEILLQALELDDERISTSIEEMQSMISKLLRWKKRSHEKISEHFSQFCREIPYKLRTLFATLSPLFFQERMNENLLMYLLEKKESFNRYLGPRTIEELFRNLFPLGAEELRIILHEGYSRRGFENFYAQKESLIDALEWEPPCDPLLQTL